ncbi:hypothetical protein ACHAW5_000581 [Stephanodiscus triporus]|uniref:CENP-V/GFA domain-containing protein n=1 Tax=Stephanodiscus triporus TaxID=2934178 RepID=A0ABD3NG71_9STRA
MTTTMMMMRGWMPWWWPLVAMRRWNERHKTVAANVRRPRVGDDGVARNGAGEEDDTACDDGEHSHRGSCHCGSIEFVLRGPRRLRAVDLPGKIRYYPHVIISADRFQLISGEDRIRFYYEDDKDDSPSSSVIAFDRHRAAAAGDGGHGEAPDRASGAHSFCGNCGAHVFHADRYSGRLEVNANCLDGAAVAAAKAVRGARASSSGVSSATASDSATACRSRSSSHRSTTSPGVVESVDDVVDEVAPENPAIVTQSEIEPPSGEGSACPSNGLDNNSNNGPTNDSLPRKESMSTDPTQAESYSTAMMLADGDDSSMGSLSVTGAYYLPAYHPSQYGVVPSSASTTSTTTHDRTGLPPLPPPSSRMILPSSDRSARTLPPRLGERYRYGRPGGVRGGSIDGGGGGWSVASAESNDLDGGDDDVRQTTISPRMMDQMKKYLGRHINPIQED